MERKWKNFLQYQRIYPDRKYIFIGDSGQLDVELASRINESGLLQLGLIHRISPSRSKEWEEKYKKTGLYFFDTYIGAAKIALEHRLLLKKDALLVMEQAKKDLKKSSSMYPEKRLAELQADSDDLLILLKDRNGF